MGNALSARTAEATAAEVFGLARPEATIVSGGRVNHTFRIDSQGRQYILQRLSDFFNGDEAVAVNWLRVYQALAERGSGPPPMPEIRPDASGRYLAPGPDGGFWRLTGFVEGRPALMTAEGAFSAARLLGRMHGLLNSPLPVELLSLPEGDFTNRHFTTPDEMGLIFSHYRGHPRLEELKGLIEEALEAAMFLPPRPELLAVFSHQAVVIHCDPKADNFLFDASGQAVCLLDWDTVCLGHSLIDLAEMMRSWGIPGRGKDFEPNWDNLAAIVRGYAASGQVIEDFELELMSAVLRGIVLNLCRRYLTDALAEAYFQLDPKRFETLYDQNRAKAQSMLALADYLLDNEMALSELFARAYEQGRRELPESV
ncbi:phosphotransferase [Deltaproteobacteria bacterium OttesenSCG-928-K17]|nr:phosphotransferase [Deltaproteobacteria bacterium OttesenSCG-928-K17]